jgi:hypothetical protein
MKRLIFYLMPLLMLAACSDDEGYSLDNFVVDIATVENPENNTAFFLNLDNNKRLWTAASDLKYYRPKDGQRVIANYTILAEKPQAASYDYLVKLNDIYEVLTKGIFKITPATQDSIGNDYVYIRDMWIGSDYLNVRFDYPGGNKVHYINLVSDSLKTYSDGKIHLEFRHNANGDYPHFNLSGIVSFNLKSLQVSGQNEVKIVVHAREFNMSESSSTYNFTYKYGTQASAIKRNMLIPANRAKVE